MGLVEEEFDTVSAFEKGQEGPLNDSPWFKGMLPEELIALRRNNPGSSEKNVFSINSSPAKPPRNKLLERLLAFMPRENWARAWNTFLEPALERRVLTPDELDQTFLGILPHHIRIGISTQGGYTPKWLHVFSVHLVKSILLQIDVPASQITPEVQQARRSILQLPTLGLRAPELGGAFRHTFGVKEPI